MARARWCYRCHGWRNDPCQECAQEAAAQAPEPPAERPDPVVAWALSYQDAKFLKSIKVRPV